MKLKKYLTFSTLFILTTSLIFLLVIIEFFFADGDGTLRGRNIKVTGFNILFIEVVIFVLYKLSIWNKKIASVIVAIISCVLTFLLVEWIVGLFLHAKDIKYEGKKRSKIEMIDYKEGILLDNVLGIRAKPNWNYQWIGKKRSDTLLFSHDQFSRRITPDNQNVTTQKNKYAIFLGCSFTYGDGVNNTQTMPYYFQQLDSSHHVYNYGFLGYSPLHTLARLQSENIKMQVPESAGFGVFTYINDHIDRTIPASRWIIFQQGKFPNLLEKSLKTDNIYRNKHRFKYELLNWMGSSNIWNYFRIGFPKQHTEKHYQLVVDVISQAKREFIRQFHHDKFYVIIFPGQNIPDYMKTMFQKANLKVYDYSKLYNLEKYMLETDPSHPRAEAYKMVMNQFYKDLIQERKL